ncbi:MAG: enoyl-CoA hydratase/isomerase family protein [Actinomycetota bacterium]
MSLQVDGGVASITLTRPEKRNAIDLELANELTAALETFHRDPATSVAVLSGEGSGFCSGGDITMFPDLDSASGLEFVRGLGERLHQSIARSRKPVIAAVHGFCLAGGFELALACHMIFASAETQFAMKEARLGLIPGWGGTVRLARTVSPGLANDLLLTGRTILAPEARQAGIVSRVFDDPESCHAAALDAARRIAGAPDMTAESVLDVVRASRASGDDAFKLEQSLVAMLFGSPQTQSRISDVLYGGIGSAE